jgi:16S rRNA processing protein RimM
VDEPTVVVGVITRAHGVRGEVAVQNRSDNPARWVPGGVVVTPDGQALTVTAVRRHGERLLVSFDGVADRETAAALAGTELAVSLTSLPELGPDEWWPHDLEGCHVVTEHGRELGILTEVVFNPANDLWVAEDDTGVETLVPARKELLVEVDVPGKRIVVRDVPGITTPEDADAG